MFGALAGSSAHAWGGGSEHTNAYGGSTSGAYGEGATHTYASGATAYRPPGSASYAGYPAYHPPVAVPLQRCVLGHSRAIKPASECEWRFKIETMAGKMNPPPPAVVSMEASPVETSIPSPLATPFSVIKKTNEISWPPPADADFVTVRVDFLMNLIRPAVARIPFDEKWYLSRYPDVPEAIVAGQFRDAHHHYVEFGFFEDRIPRAIDVDTEFYLAKYSDVADGVQGGTLESAQWHFERYGFREGRLPQSGWRLG